MFQNLRIRSKLIVILAAPVAALVLMASLGAIQRRDSASKSRFDQRLITVSRANSNLSHELGKEALLSSSVAGSPLRTQLAKQRPATDRAAAGLKAELQAFGGQGDLASTKASETVQARLATLSTLRGTVDRNEVPPAVTSSIFSDAISELLTLSPLLSTQGHNPSASAAMTNISALQDFESTVADGSAQVAGVVDSGVFASQVNYQSFFNAASAEQVRQAVFVQSASPRAKSLLNDALSGSAVKVVNDERDILVRDGATGSSHLDVPTWSSAVLTKLNQVHSVGDKLFSTALTNAQGRTAAAQRSANLFILGALLAVAVAVALAWFVARAITRPLLRLTGAAKNLAEEHLPRLVDSLRNPAADDVGFLTGAVAKIDVAGDDEVGQLASAFNDVQTVAVSVAGEQAALLRKGIGDMFVNLARRNQGLLDRQIEFIDQLEAKEEDPDQLEHLFHLDHLATRMRRNAESLLVLAGAEPSRRRGRPVPLTDVVRAALGEVEDFARIDLLHLDDVLMASNASSDVAHLLSELMENATNFSPPDTRVEVVGHRTKVQGYVISITDVGIGMDAGQLADANETLARPPLVGLAMSRSLGFIVIGRLAARFGIAVRLMPSPSAGVTAVVALPPMIVNEMPGSEPAPISAKVVADASNGQSSNGQGVAATAAGPGAGENWTNRVVDSGSSILPPLAFTPFSHEEGSTADKVSSPGARSQDGPGSSLPRLAPPGEPEPPADGRPGLFGPAPDGALDTAEGPKESKGTKATGGKGLPTRQNRPKGDPPTSAESPSAPAAPPAVAPAEPASAGNRLFGAPKPAGSDGSPPGAQPGPLATPEPVSAGHHSDAGANGSSGEAASASPPVSRLFGGVGSAANGNGNGTGNGNANGNGTSIDSGHGMDTDAGGTAAVSAEPGGGAGGLARRTPRQASAGGRAKPGWDGPERQGVTAPRRSPEQVRNLLANYRSGAQKGRTDDSESKQSTDESHED